MRALSTHELTKDYAIGFWRKRPYRALDHLSLEVQTGEVFGFLGPNGAGKTTTLKLLMQLVYPTSGRAQDSRRRPLGDRSTKHRIGYLPENPYFYDHLTAEELLVYFGALFGFSARDARARASRLLDEVGIAAERRLQLRKFSKGMLQRASASRRRSSTIPSWSSSTSRCPGSIRWDAATSARSFSGCAIAAARSFSVPTC